MTLHERLQTEIKTIKEHTFVLKLSDADVKRIFEKAGSVGLTATELMQSFIGDLVDGTYSNGSDERDYAQQWFDRCGFEAACACTFLRYLIQYDALDSNLACKAVIRRVGVRHGIGLRPAHRHRRAVGKAVVGVASKSITKPPPVFPAAVLLCNESHRLTFLSFYKETKEAKRK